MTAHDDPDAVNLSALPATLPPPSALEDRVTAAVMADRRARGGPGAWRLAAASVVLFALGYATAELSRPAPTAISADATGRFALMLYDVPGTDTADPSQTPALVAEYTAWAAAERRAGVLELGEHLGDEIGRTGPDPASAPVAGLFIVRARSAEEAMSIASRCPHTQHGGAISVRQLFPSQQ
jgi:hypothetical protein